MGSWAVGIDVVGVQTGSLRAPSLEVRVQLEITWLELAMAGAMMFLKQNRNLEASKLAGEKLFTSLKNILEFFLEKLNSIQRCLLGAA